MPEPFCEAEAGAGFGVPAANGADAAVVVAVVPAAASAAAFAVRVPAPPEGHAPATLGAVTDDLGSGGGATDIPPVGASPPTVLPSPS